MSRTRMARQLGAVASTVVRRGSRDEQPLGLRRRRRVVWLLLGLCGLALLYSLPVLTIPVINTPQVSFASVLFYPIGIYVLLSLGLDMTVGRTGQINLGYAAFFACGAYTTALLSTRAGMNYYETILPAVAASMVLGLIVGVVSLRVSGDYFAIVTLGIGLTVQEILANVGLFGTTIGISSIPPPSRLLGLSFSVLSPKSYDWLIFTMVIVVSIVFWLLYRNALGRAWAAIREDEGAAELMGVKVRKLKVVASTIGAAPGGLAGSIYASQVGYVSPDAFGLTLSILVLAAVALGGKGRIAGVILGAVLVGYLPERFLAIDRINTLLFGIVLVVVMLFRPEGILGSLLRQRPSRTGARDAATDGILLARWRVVRGRRRAPIGALVLPATAAIGSHAGSVVSGWPPGMASVAPHAAESAESDAWANISADELVGLRIVPVRGTSRAGGQAALTVDGAHIAFGGVSALRNVSLTVAPGLVTSVIGPNGAGKTTLINAITGVYRLDRGRVLLGGVDVTYAPIAERAQRGLGRTFQNLRLFGGMSALENVLVAVEARGGRHAPIGGDRRLLHTSNAVGGVVEEAMALLEAVGLASIADVRSDQLPYGAQRRLEVARALALDPKVVLLDEPAAGANTTEKQELTELIRKIAESGRSVLLVEHDMRLVMEISTKIVVLNFGEVIAEGSPSEVRSDPAVIAAYLGQGDDV